MFIAHQNYKLVIFCCCLSFSFCWFPHLKKKKNDVHLLSVSLINTVGESYCPLLKNYRSEPPASTWNDVTPSIALSPYHILYYTDRPLTTLYRVYYPPAYIFIDSFLGVMCTLYLRVEGVIRQPHLQCCNMTDNRKQSRHYYCYSLSFYFLVYFWERAGGGGWKATWWPSLGHCLMSAIWL